jgi:hypothetical protein
MSNLMPPREKIHEALSAIADNRITMYDTYAEVSSSDNSKKYTVEWNDNAYSSNDNATYWQGYPGYPVIAILLLQGKIKYDDSIVDYFKGIEWKKLNKKFKNDYSKSIESVYEELKNNNVNIDHIEEVISNIYNELKELDIRIKKGIYPPQ